MKTEETSGGTSPKTEGKPLAPKQEKTAPSKIASLMKNVGLWLIFLLIGALAVALPLYLPARANLNQAQAEIERLTEIEGQYNELLPKFDLAKAQSTVYKIISDTSLLRSALTEKDTTKANQQLRYVEDDLNKLAIAEYPEILQRLQSQFDKLKASTPSNNEKALTELDEFYKDLLQLADNLE